MSFLNDEREMAERNAAADRYAKRHGCSPGWWAVQPLQADHGASLAIVCPDNGYIVATIPFDPEIQTDDDPDSETVVRYPADEANARLLASAPRLLDALRKCIDFIENVTDDDPARQEKFFACREAWRNAFADAQGAE